MTLGKFSVVDIFDANTYAYDPRGDFLNWAMIDGGAFNYAADAWGYSIGGAAELYHGGWTVRVGLFNLSTVPNGEKLDRDFSQYELVGEVERRYRIGGLPGTIRLTGWANHGRMARLDAAVAAASPAPRRILRPSAASRRRPVDRSPRL